jgi:acetylornithine/N-succinyldiaminopimelate aminotransferase
MGALSATPNQKYREPYEPLLPGMEVSELNDSTALEAMLDETFAAVIVEVIQGEGGLRMVEPGFAQTLNRLCRELDVLLIADEIQTGLGRAGALFASELVGLEPDILCLSKPLAGGLPLSATVIPERVDELLHAGDHGSTFGGGPVTCAVAQHVVDVISDPVFLQAVADRAATLTRLLDEMVREVDVAVERRGAGLLQGLVIAGDDPASRVSDVMGSCREQGVLLLRSSSDVVRIAPPLTISNSELERGLSVLRAALTAPKNGGSNGTG